MMPAAKHFDPVLGIDVHIVQPPGPVTPIPVPHPFIGMILDPFDYLPLIGATVLINAVPRAQAGTGGIAMPPHIPIGGVFVKPPANECEMFMGSSTVQIDGEAASHMALPVLSCQDVGVFPPPRVKKKSKIRSFVMPTSVVLPIPTGPPVLIGGPPTISLFAIGARLGMAGLARGFRKLKAMRKAGKGAPTGKPRARAGTGPDGGSGFGRGGGGMKQATPRSPKTFNTPTAVPVSIDDLKRANRMVDELLGSGKIRLDQGKPLEWREAVRRDLLTIASTDVGRRVLDDLAGSGKPLKIQSLDTDNAMRSFTDQRGPRCMYDDPSQIGPAGTNKAGTSSTIYYEPGQPCGGFVPMQPGKGVDSPSDVVLLHELDHAERAAHGENLNHRYPPGSQEEKLWLDREEVEAVGTENLYRQQRGGVRQRVNYADIP